MFHLRMIMLKVWLTKYSHIFSNSTNRTLLAMTELVVGITEDQGAGYQNIRLYGDERSIRGLGLLMSCFLIC